MTENLKLLLEYPDSIAAGLVIAAVCAVLGVFVILKRVVFIGIVLSEVAALGVAAAMIFHIHPFLGASVLTLLTVTVLAQPFETKRIPRDAILGIIFVLAAGLSILIVSKSAFALHDIKNLLYGDLLYVSPPDRNLILATLLPVLAYLILFIRPTLYSFLDREAARVLGIRVVVWELLFFFGLGLAVSAASKAAGALLVFCYLIVAPSAALLLSKRLWIVLILAVLFAVSSTLVGLYLSVSHEDLPMSQTLAVTTCVWVAIAFAIGALRAIATRLRAT